MPLVYFNNGYSFGNKGSNYVLKAGEALLPEGATVAQLTAAFPNYAAGDPTLMTPEKIRSDVFLNDADRQVLIDKLVNATPDQIRSYVLANVTDLASARLMLTKIILVLATVAKQ